MKIMSTWGAHRGRFRWDTIIWDICFSVWYTWRNVGKPLSYPCVIKPTIKGAPGTYSNHVQKLRASVCTGICSPLLVHSWVSLPSWIPYLQIQFLGLRKRFSALDSLQSPCPPPFKRQPDFTYCPHTWAPLSLGHHTVSIRPPRILMLGMAVGSFLMKSNQRPKTLGCSLLKTIVSLLCPIWPGSAYTFPPQRSHPDRDLEGRHSSSVSQEPVHLLSFLLVYLMVCSLLFPPCFY